MVSNSDMRVHVISAPVRRQVLETIRSAIGSGRFAPGHRLVERELCELLGVSRPSVREALRQLESEGLVETTSNRGPIIARLTIGDVTAIYQVRAVLEALAAGLFVANATTAQIDTLRSAFSELVTALKVDDIEAAIEAKDAFYAVLLRGSGNAILPMMLRTMNARVIMLRRFTLSSPERRPASLRELRALLAAIKKRDVEAAQEAARLHVVAAADAALRALSEQQSKT